MQKQVYKNYRICNVCGKKLPLSREYFKRHVHNNTTTFYNTCKNCCELHKCDNIWRNGLLFCNKCKKYKSEYDFGKNGSKSECRHFRRYVCKECTNSMLHNIVNKLDKEILLKRCLKFRLLGAKDRSKKHNIYFDLTLNQIENLWKKQNGLCALSNIPMTFSIGKGRISSNVSIDRINPKLGYTIKNIQLVCMECNLIKSDFLIKDVYHYCKAICTKYENAIINSHI